MNAFVVAFIFSLGGATWVFSKLQQRAGYGNNQEAFMGAGLTFFIMFIVVFSLAHMLVK